MDKKEAVHSLGYFWKERGCIERLSDYEKALDLCPRIKRAYEDYKYAEKVLDLIVKEQLDQIDDS